nr:hypothetical protein [Rhizocola hellebori]
MTSTSTEPALEREEMPVENPPTSPSRWRADVLVCLSYVLLAWWLTAGLWRNPDTRTLGLNVADQTLVEWFLSYASRVWLGDFSLVTDRLNAPDGINMLTNAATVGLGVIFAPVTFLFGAPTTFALIMLVNLAATAVGWYLLMVKVMRLSRPASAVAAAFCGFAPGMVSQSNSHLHITAQWLVPLMIWCVITMMRSAADRRRAWRLAGASALFGLLVVVQVFIGEETLLLVAFSLVVMTVVYIIWERPPLSQIGRFAAGVVMAVSVAVPLLIYPLWTQFNGPQSVPNGVFSPDYFSADVASFVAYSPLSIAGTPENARLSTGAAEYNTFFGWPLVLLVLALGFWLRRNAIAVACVAATIVMALLSLGPKIVIERERTTFSGPYLFFKGVPVIDGALPMRFALAMIPLIAILLAIAWDQASRDSENYVRFGVPAFIVAALLPLLPTPLPTTDRVGVPVFYTEGHWRECASDGDVIVPVPPATPHEPGPMRFATAADAAFSMPEGFFIGPYGRGGSATVGTYKLPTSATLAAVAKTGKLPDGSDPSAVTDQMRAQARADLARWGASCVVLTAHPYAAELRTTVEALLGPGRPVADAVIWPISR